MLSKSAIHLYHAVHEHANINTLKTTLDLTDTEFNDAKQELIDTHLIEQHHTHSIEPTDTAVNTAYRVLLTKHHHIDPPNLLTPAVLTACAALYNQTSLTADELTQQSTLTPDQTSTALETLAHRALITNTDDMHAFTKDIEGTLGSFANALATHIHQHRVTDINPAAQPIWSNANEALISFLPHAESGAGARSHFADVDQWHTTGLAVFEQYELQFFIAGEPLVFYTETGRTLTPVDYIAHTLAEEHDTRRLSYATLFTASESLDRTSLYDAMRPFGLEDLAVAIDVYLTTRGSVTNDYNFPSWNEFENLCDQYDVSI